MSYGLATTVRGTYAPVEEPSTASDPDIDFQTAFASHGISKGFARQSIECGKKPVAPSPDWIILKEQRKGAYASRPLEAAEDNVIGVGRYRAAKVGLRCEDGTHGLQTLPERQHIRVAIGSDFLQGRAKAFFSRPAKVSAVLLVEMR